MADDPRNPDEVYYDAMMERGAELMRVETFVVADALRRWRPYANRLTDTTERALRNIRSRGTGVLSQKQFDALLGRQRRIVRDGMRAVRKAFTTHLDDLASRELRWTLETMSDALPNFDFRKLRPATARKVWKQTPMTGRKLSEWWTKTSANTLDAVAVAVRNGVIEGQTVSQIVGRIRLPNGALSVSTRDLETMARTGVQHVSAQVRKEVALENRSALREEIWIATLDTRTCPACASEDQRRWKVGQGPYPPLHPRCRCARGAYFAGTPVGERASRDGPVPGDTSYSDWLRRQSAAAQNKVLGPTRAKLFREGKLGDLKPEFLIDANNRPLPVRDLLTKLERRGEL